MTADGIINKDWEKVERAAFAITNALLQEDEVLVQVHGASLREVLMDLESRYGRLPSILATRADFSDCATEAIALHQEALELATDEISKRLSLQSLVGLLIEGRFEREVIANYLVQLEQVTGGERSDLEELAELQASSAQSVASGPS